MTKDIMYRIYSDETWTTPSAKRKEAYFVFYGVMVKGDQEEGLLQEIDEFRHRRGLIADPGVQEEIKWDRVEKEWKQAEKTGLKNRYEEFLDLFFDAVNTRRLSFGYMFLRTSEYERVKVDFQKKHPENKQNYFFMMCFQFLYHCFIKKQVGRNPCQIFIDNRNMGAEHARYDINQLKDILNQRNYRDMYPRDQLQIFPEIQAIRESIALVDLAESKQQPLIQLADLCAGCVRYILENEIQPPREVQQMSLFEKEKNDEEQLPDSVTPGRWALAHYFYSKLRSIRRYKDINLLDISFHFSFNIFPFKFK